LASVFVEKIVFFLSGLRRGGIDRVELVGGSTRIPAVKNLIRDLFNIEPTAAVNQVCPAAYSTTDH
jgi:molecular chaperone DnaK (HSP70)